MKRAKRKTASEKVQSKPKSWHTCWACAENFGGVMPDKERAITVMVGTCPDCEDAGVTLVPLMDFNWPDGRKAWVD